MPTGQGVQAEVTAKRVLHQHMPFKAFMPSSDTLERCQTSIDCKLKQDFESAAVCKQHSLRKSFGDPSHTASLGLAEQ